MPTIAIKMERRSYGCRSVTEASRDMEVLEGSACDQCKTHIATQSVSDSGLAWAHGAFSIFCDCCYIRREIDEARAAAARLPELLQAQATVQCKAGTGEMFYENPHEYNARLAKAFEEARASPSTTSNGGGPSNHAKPNQRGGMSQ